MVSSFLAVCSGVKAGNHVQVQNKQPHKVVPALGHGSQEIMAIKKLECVCVRGNDGTCHQCNTNVFRIVFFCDKNGALWHRGRRQQVAITSLSVWISTLGLMRKIQIKQTYCILYILYT